MKSNVIKNPFAKRAAPVVRRAGLAQGAVLAHFARLQEGAVTVVADGTSHEFGDPSSGLCCHIYVNDSSAWRQIAFGGALGAAEAYMDGAWTTDDLTVLVRILLRNRDVLNGLDSGTRLHRRLAAQLYHALRRDSVSGSRRNITAHYDLGNDFFRLFLDPTMMYSCGVFEAPSESMETASIRKIDALCEKLQLTESDSVIEIGSGWGAFAIHAATRYGCHVTTTTISDAQYRHTARRVAELGLGDRITVLQQDYRHLEGTFDKLVSIEMIEAVGISYLPQFFRKCAALLKDDGEMILQCITIADQHFDHARKGVDFIQRYIFPGGALPSVTALLDASTRHTDLRSFDLTDITLHYALTLSRWRDAFVANLDEVRALGFDQRFIRMWEYYLSYCEGGFRERAIGCIQIKFHRPAYRPRELRP